MYKYSQAIYFSFCKKQFDKKMFAELSEWLHYTC